jgi:1,4-dihydroxy-2-naphthoate octaprenyltransferase
MAPVNVPTALLAMARPSQLVLILLVYASGILVAVWRYGITDMALALLGAGLLIPAGVAVHWANEAADEATDALAVRTPFSGGSGGLARSGIVPGLLTRWSFVLAAVVMTGTVAVVALGLMPIGAGLLLLAGVVGGMAYSAAPVVLMRRGVGEPVNAVLGGLLLPLYGVASAAGRVEMLDILAFLPFAFITFCSVMATAWPDRVADGMTGKRTLQVRLSSPRLRALYAASAIAWAVSLGIAAWNAALPFGLVVFAILPSVWLGWAWYTRRRSPWPSVVSMVGHIVAMAAATVAAIVVAA